MLQYQRHHSRDGLAAETALRLSGRSQQQMHAAIAVLAVKVLAHFIKAGIVQLGIEHRLCVAIGIRPNLSAVGASSTRRSVGVKDCMPQKAA